MADKRFDADLDVGLITVPVAAAADLSTGLIDDLVERFNRYGLVLLDFAARPRAVENLLSLAPLFGRVAPHKLADVFGVFHIHPREQPNPWYPATTDIAYEPHTDGAFQPVPEAVVALQCVVPASRGGESLLVSAPAMLGAVEGAFGVDALAALSSPGAIRIERDGEETTGPVLFRAGSLARIRYRSDPHALIDVAEPARAAYRRMRDHLLDPRNVLKVALRPGQVLLVDNYSVLHGRAGFEGGGGRDYKRLNFMGDGRLADRLRFGFNLH